MRTIFWIILVLWKHNFPNVLISFKFPLYDKQTNASRTSSVSKFGKFSFSPNLENACKNNIPGTKKCLPTRCL